MLLAPHGTIRPLSPAHDDILGASRDRWGHGCRRGLGQVDSLATLAPHPLLIGALTQGRAECLPAAACHKGDATDPTSPGNAPYRRGTGLRAIYPLVGGIIGPAVASGAMFGSDRAGAHSE